MVIDIDLEWDISQSSFRYYNLCINDTKEESKIINVISISKNI